MAPGDTFDVADDPLDLFPDGADAVPGARTAIRSFWGGYVEAGYYLTGETRGYKNGTWDRTKVLKPFSKGGWGALQVNARIDYLDLDSQQAAATASPTTSQTGAVAASIEPRPRRQAARPARQPDLDPRRLYAHVPLNIRTRSSRRAVGGRSAKALPHRRRASTMRKYGVDFHHDPRPDRLLSLSVHSPPERRPLAPLGRGGLFLRHLDGPH